eukprot:jgi/Tetstr1/446181/TSEL_003582.t1
MAAAAAAAAAASLLRRGAAGTMAIAAQGQARALSTASLSDFDFHLPQELVAQVPAEPRDSARLMVVRRAEGTIEHAVFRQLPDILSPAHMLVANNSRVVNCKLAARGPRGAPLVLYLLQQLDDGGAMWEVSGDDAYEALPPGAAFSVDTPGGAVEGRVLAAEGLDAPSRATFRAPAGCGSVSSLLREAASVPLPPYIHSTAGADSGGYQTVYAKEDGSVAAPTAGLHFTEEVLERLAARGVARQELTLHVGYGTFGHVRHDDLSQHRMHSEVFTISDPVAAAINTHRRAGRPLLAVGTTSTRVLESCAAEDGTLTARSGETDIFIHPGYRFRAVDALLTNFHMPKLTPIMLVAAFAGYDLTMKAYEEAVKERYRFFSFGDSMLIL